MRLIFTCSFLILSNYLFAQKKDSVTISIDTINIRGVIYNYDGKPAKNILVSVFEGHAPGYPSIVKADSNGYFTLKGIMPNNRLMVSDHKSDFHLLPVKGNRFMTIYLPPQQVRDIDPWDSIIVKAHRENQRMKFSYRVSTQDLHQGIFPHYEDPPLFHGGNSKFIDYVRKSLVYPEKAIKNNVEGTVTIAFTISTNGLLTDFEILKGIGYGCDEEIIEILKKSPKWRPGISLGHPIIARQSVSVKFSLTDN